MTFGGVFRCVFYVFTCVYMLAVVYHCRGLLVKRWNIGIVLGHICTISEVIH